MRITIDRLAYGGDGVGHMPDGRTAFVRGGCPGDVVDASVTNEHARYANLVTTEVLEASPSRVAPPCPYFGTCGGCQWQHVDYATQLAAKHDAVADALRRIGHVEVAVDEPVASPLAYGYRNKVELSVARSNRGLTVGFTRAGSADIVPVDSCLLLAEAHRKAPKAIAGALKYLSGNRTELGFVRAGLRASTNFRDTEVAIWTEPGPFPRQLAARTLAEATRATGVIRVLTKGEPSERNVSGVEVLKGPGAWRERIGRHIFLASAPSFFQVNTRCAERLVDLAVEALAPDGTDRVLDLYAGVGTFTIPLSELAGEVVAVEQSGSALADLRRNLESAKSYADVVPGDAARALPELGRFDSVLVDPPRAGMSESALRALLDLGAAKVVYVSCDPATLARDSVAFAAAKYSLIRVIPVDLFPQTYHVETVAVFERQGS